MEEGLLFVIKEVGVWVKFFFKVVLELKEVMCLLLCFSDDLLLFFEVDELLVSSVI